MNIHLHRQKIRVITKDLALDLPDNAFVFHKPTGHTLLALFELFEQNQVKSTTDIVFVVANISVFFEQLTSKFVHIKAAGGVVIEKETNKMLFIERMNHWDLPKGKFEKNESAVQTAEREVFEETNVRAKVSQHLLDTFHTYRINKYQIALKESNWFEMFAYDNQDLVAQKEEGISQVTWFSAEQIDKIVKPTTYPSILEVLDAWKKHNLLQND